MNKTTPIKLVKSYRLSFSKDGENVKRTILAVSFGEAVLKLRKRGITGTIENIF